MCCKIIRNCLYCQIIRQEDTDAKTLTTRVLMTCSIGTWHRVSSNGVKDFILLPDYIVLRKCLLLWLRFLNVRKTFSAQYIDINRFRRVLTKCHMLGMKARLGKITCPSESFVNGAPSNSKSSHPSNTTIHGIPSPDNNRWARLPRSIPTVVSSFRQLRLRKFGERCVVRRLIFNNSQIWCQKTFNKTERTRCRIRLHPLLAHYRFRTLIRLRCILGSGCRSSI